MKLRVLLADDHAMIREGLALLVDAQPDMHTVGQAADGTMALRLAQELHPDIAVLDISMPRLGGAEAAERIRAACPRTRVIALTRHAEPAYVRRLLHAGADGYVLKKSAAESLIAAIRAVAQGGTYVEPALGGSLLQRAFGNIRGTPDKREGGPLSEREEEVVRGIAWGRSNKEIAADLGLSIKTVESYKAGALDKLGLRTRGDIVRYAMGRGWLTEDGAPE